MIFRDVTAFKLLEEEKNEVKLMKMLHATVSHDILNPIGTIEVFAEQMLSEGIKYNIENMRKYRDFIIETTKIVTCRMKDLLD